MKEYVKIGDVFKRGDLTLIVVEDALGADSKCENCVTVESCDPDGPVCIARLRADKKNVHFEVYG